MDKVTKYSELVKRILEDQASQWQHDDIEAQLIFDDERRTYQLMLLGWEGYRRTYTSVVHVRIRNQKCYIEWDGTHEEESMTTALLEASVPHDDIVLAFYSPKKRRLTEFAVA